MNNIENVMSLGVSCLRARLVFYFERAIIEIVMFIPKTYVYV